MLSTHLQSSNWDIHVNAQHFEPNEKFINMSKRPLSSMPKNESDLVNDCRRALVNGKIKTPMDHVRMICLARGASGIYNLGRSFRRLSGQGDRLTLDGFVKGLQDVKMDCTDEEAADIFRAFDTDKKGYIDMKEFLLELRMRETIVDKCFKKSVKDDDDVITVGDLRRSYSVKHHPSYVNGDEDKETILKRFLATFEEGDNLSAKITREDFLNYYAGISATIEDDGYFDLLLREEYKL